MPIACAFYGASPILIPPGQSIEILAPILQESKAEVVFALAGVISQSELASRCPQLKNIIWSVEQTSRHMDFLEPEASRNSTTYHDLVEQSKENAASTLPTDTDITNAPNVFSIWQAKNAKSYEIIEFTQAVSIFCFNRA